MEAVRCHHSNAVARLVHLRSESGTMASDFLFVRPSFARGVARLMDIGGALDRTAYNFSESPAESDTKALLSDWQVLAEDMAGAFDETFYRVAEAAGARGGTG
jgi:hypothetical protein